MLLKNYHGGIEVFADRCGVDPASPVRSDRRFNYLRTGALFEKGEPVTTSLDDITPNFGVLRPEDEIDRYYSILLDAKKIKFDRPYDLCLMLVGGTLGSLYYSNTVRIPAALLNDAISSIPSTQ